MLLDAQGIRTAVSMRMSLLFACILILPNQCARFNLPLNRSAFSTRGRRILLLVI
jgi:hypothetical protein